MSRPPWLAWKGKRKDPNTVGLRHGFRSGLEKANADHLKANGIKVVFEKVRVKYVVPAFERTYTPDFELPNGVIVETKGRFLAVDRAKHLYVKLAHPLLDIRFVFNNPNGRDKGSKTTYAQWCEMHGFKWAKKLIPIAWAKEPPFDASAPRGPRTIAVPPEAADLFANSSRQPLKARGLKAGRLAALARPKDGPP